MIPKQLLFNNMNPQKIFSVSSRKGFSLIEVVLAIGIFMVTVLALVGLIGPTLKSVDEVEQTDAIISVVNSLNTFLQQSPDIALNGGSKFDAVYNAIVNDGQATVFVFQSYIGDSTETELKVGFYDETSVSGNAKIEQVDFVQNGIPKVAGSIFRAVISASSVTPEIHRTLDRDPNTQIFTLTKASADIYPEGYLAMEVRLYSEEYSSDFNSNFSTRATTDLNRLAERDSIFTYNVAIVR
jgi:type II secretory pathway pseudopilin PulG